ncbi:hypothetical protein Moror_12295 [Moniliophthora roreri MCA 2997]|uniref:Uncharacterized protein n=2 Tax=Moniliophthora roreri TaxID=221103 RepID=V2XQ75_MONRO|nr:hypothetical protein Moror_12295 [Moniliophthora roreri MCA 2997]
MSSRQVAHPRRYLKAYQESSEELTQDELIKRALKPTSPCSNETQMPKPLSTLPSDRWVGPWWGGRDAYRPPDPFDLLCSPEEWVEMYAAQEEDETATLVGSPVFGTEKSMILDYKPKSKKKQKAKLAAKSSSKEARIQRALATGTVDPREVEGELPDENCGMASRKMA